MTMGTEKIFQKKRILYCADPKRLTIKVMNIIHLINRQIREPFSGSIPMKESDRTLLSACDNFPIEVGGVWYFESEEEARGFIKRIIGF
ncbi:MAG: hypothetical protein LBR34_08910 [Prevotella sp.]|nr:hypothetical protein [Prevotella sp.]